MSPSTEVARLCARVDLHPVGATPAAMFEAAAHTAGTVAADCLPLGIAVVMHLYPLCALRCVPLPWFSSANCRRAALLRTIDKHSLMLANAGSERAAAVHPPVLLSRTRDGVLVNGTFDYVSLAHVADIVLFSAPCDGYTVFCAADLRAASVAIGGSKFTGSMQLSDTCAVSFVNHRVPPDHYIVAPSESAFDCMAQYQRSWLHLLLGASYLARMTRLRQQWSLPQSTEEITSLNELTHLREYSLRLLDEAASPGIVQTLSRVTAAMKLRISWHAQSTASALRGLNEVAASELGYLARQPTSDARILRNIGAGACMAR